MKFTRPKQDPRQRNRDKAFRQRLNVGLKKLRRNLHAMPRPLSARQRRITRKNVRRATEQKRLEALS